MTTKYRPSINNNIGLPLSKAIGFLWCQLSISVNGKVELSVGDGGCGRCSCTSEQCVERVRAEGGGVWDEREGGKEGVVDEEWERWLRREVEW
jgi:hypothetical protein